MECRLSTVSGISAVLLAIGSLTACSGDPAPTHAETITLTLMRHAESTGNQSGLIDTSVPGPSLTEEGRRQAQAAADTFAGQDFDGVYASSMVRTRQTAEYMANAVGEPVEILPGLREIEAGSYEGQPEATAQSTYLAAPLDWVQGRRDERIPGSLDGNEFDERFDEAVAQIYENDDTKPIAFAHGGSIMIWTLMNVENSDLSLISQNPLRNTGYVVVTGNPDDGWTLVDWNGTKVAA